MYKLYTSNLDGTREQVHESRTIAAAVLWALLNPSYIHDDDGKRLEYPAIVKQL